MRRYSRLVDIERRIARCGNALTPAERKVAATLLADPQGLAYQTVSAIAEASGTGVASVVRLANKLGFDGFSALQAAAQKELEVRLRPAAARIREASGSPAVHRHAETEVLNVASTLDGLDAAALEAAVARLSSLKATVYVVSGDASRGVAQQFLHDLSALRPGVVALDGNEVAVQRTLAGVTSNDVMVAIDLRRYDRWLVEAVRGAAEAGVWCVAITDSVLSPLASAAALTFIVHADSVGPFDSHVGTLSLLNLVVAGVADRNRRTATVRLEQAEAAWLRHNALTDS